MNRLPRLLVPAMVAALLLVALPGSTVTAAKPGLTGLGATGQTSATVGELATLRLRLPASVAAFEGRVLAAPGAVEVVGVAPLKGGTGLRPEDTGDGIAIGAWNLGGARRGTVVNVAVAPLVEGRIQLRVVIDAASDAQGRRVQLAADTVLATITAGDGARVITAPVVRRDPAPRAKAQKPRDLRADRRFTRAAMKEIPLQLL